ncbi:MAG TPA: nascent polypeptide-associated complex protein [Candidatus Nanoarchaeia archaeon]|nr:nascent polypeptide-associated complex protein [Candidatus Nanoarchaeia archaeon]
MFPGMNKRQMDVAMRKLGIQQQEIDAVEVIIRTKDKEIIIENPQVSKVNMMGQQTFQVVGRIIEKQISSEPEINEEDIKTVMEQTNASREEALDAIKSAKGDLAQAILDLRRMCIASSKFST